MTKIRSCYIVLCSAFLGIPACAKSPNASAEDLQSTDAVQLPRLVGQGVSTGATMQALFMGRLHLDANGCLRGGSETGPIIIWHQDTRIERAADGGIRIYDAGSGNSVHVGDEIALSGGFRAGPAINVTQPVPPTCQHQSRLFVAKSVRL